MCGGVHAVMIDQEHPICNACLIFSVHGSFNNSISSIVHVHHMINACMGRTDRIGVAIGCVRVMNACMWGGTWCNRRNVDQWRVAYRWSDDNIFFSFKIHIRHVYDTTALPTYLCLDSLITKMGNHAACIVHT